MDFTKALLSNPIAAESAPKSMKRGKFEVVARDGIEPPTPAFSGLDSFRAIVFSTKGKRSLFVPKTAHLLGQ